MKTLSAIFAGVAGFLTITTAIMKWPAVVASCFGLVVVLLCGFGAFAWWLLAAFPIWFVGIIVLLILTTLGLVGAQ